MLFSPTEYPDLLVGLGAPDDAAVYRISDDRAIISTTDFFPPVVDDPWTFGAIAAANALSDVYAMGGQPLMAINLVAWPDGLPQELLTEILRGGAEKVREAGAVLAGGHTVSDKEPKYGLCVTGIVHPDRIIRKGGALPGDRLILSKPLGVGVITTALKNSKAQEQHVAAAVASMGRLNRSAAEQALRHGVRAMTDITGYGLIGHGLEMAQAAGVDFHIAYSALRWLPGAQDYAAQDSFPGGMHRNREFYTQHVRFDAPLPDHQQYLLFDPQTSGGLLMAAPAEQAEALLAALTAAGESAALIGEVQTGDGRIVVTT